MEKKLPENLSQTSSQKQTRRPVHSNQCPLHPEKKIIARCEKFGKSYCKKCLEQGLAHCPSPEMHCKFRASCLVWFLTHSKEKKLPAETN